ncbi:MAG: Enoyl-CoA-hydratase [Alphaproteobacteria bacterium MarineAlpha3_Bin7]|nr:MAG: Enoyl-CoA-hydratase [Alphaproteobacteria bacterium MarineAlpha3_Bin7]|tara:strand:- start:195 stop:926 length:732 start_codon:yes stop_codon:yes gene_type:complete
MKKLFTTKVKDQIFYLTIKNSENGNRVSDQLATELTQTIDTAALDQKAIVIITEGEDFCLGRAVMGEPEGKLPEAYEMRHRFDAVFNFYDSFRRSPIPIICGVQGKAIGFGCAMAAICDITISAQDAIFQLPETSHGIMPTMAMSSLIDRVQRKAILYLTYTAMPVDAKYALNSGLISQIVPAKKLHQSLEEAAEAIRQIPFPAINAVKEFSSNSIGLPISAAEDYARSLHSLINSSEAMREK